MHKRLSSFSEGTQEATGLCLKPVLRNCIFLLMLLSYFIFPEALRTSPDTLLPSPG